MIARAAGGSVRDGLSILDQAIAMGSGTVTAATVRDMLGLADRGRVFDLLEALLAGTPAQALTLFGGLHADGAEPTQLIADLAETVHVVTRCKAMGSDTGSDGLAAEERRRATALAGRLSMPLLARAWQMLLKGLDEAGKAPDPLAAAEMVLIRIAYTADLPPPDEIVKALGGAGQIARRAGAPADKAAPAGRGPVNELPPAAADIYEDVSANGEASRDEPPPLEAYGDLADADAGEDLVEGLGDEDDAPLVSAGTPALRVLRTFEDVVALAGERRDARLRAHLEEHVSLVKFDGAAGSIDLFLLPGASPEIANDLREKLNRWTGRRWMVVLSKARGDLSLGEQKRQREAAELQALKSHPAVAAVFEAFPDAKVAAVRTTVADRVDDDRDDETGTG